MTVLYWYRRDYRLSDNPALAHAIALANDTGQGLLPVVSACDNPPTPWSFVRRGPHRLAYEAQARAGLATRLKALGSDLYEPDQAVAVGEAVDGGVVEDVNGNNNKQTQTIKVRHISQPSESVQALVDLAQRMQVSHIVCEAINAPEELDEIHALKHAGLNVTTIEQSALLPHDSLPFELSKTPTVFSEFRRQVEKAKVMPRTPLAAPAQMPRLPDPVVGAQPHHSTAAWSVTPPATPPATPPTLDSRSALPYQLPDWQGDEDHAQAHLGRYFASTLPGRYKTTRNGLIGTDYSTKFSPWLANGALSAAQIYQALQDHEATYGGNDSTYWICFELLWRDHFRLMMQRFGGQLFRRDGLAKSPVASATHNPQGFKRWCAGQTGHAFIDAGMRELAATGYLSNRMRQNVASYLIHDLGADWRAGAAWFEHCLVDFDVHSNQGNWAYIAGVGTDPRGGRRFNPEKQAHDYDRDASYRQLWSDT